MSENEDLKCVVIDILKQAESDAAIGWTRNPENEIHEDLKGLFEGLDARVKGDAARINRLLFKLGQAVERTP